MTRLLHALVCSSVLMGSAAAVHAQDVIELPLILQPGDRLEISYSHERNDSGQVNGTNIVGESLIGNVDQDGFRATWTTISMEVGGQVIDSSHPEAPALMLGIPIGYMADADGMPIRIDDRQEFLDLTMAAVAANRGGEVVDQEAIARTRALFDSMDDETLAAAFVTVPKYLAICQGTALEPGQPNTVEVEAPSPVGTAPVRAVVSYLLKEIDEVEGTAQVEYRSILDPAGTEQLVKDFLAQLVGPEEIPESEFEGMSIERNDSASCEVNLESGVAESVTYVTETKVLDQSRTETLVFSVVHSSPRGQ